MLFYLLSTSNILHTVFINLKRKAFAMFEKRNKLEEVITSEGTDYRYKGELVSKWLIDEKENTFKEIDKLFDTKDNDKYIDALYYSPSKDKFYANITYIEDSCIDIVMNRRNEHTRHARFEFKEVERKNEDKLIVKNLERVFGNKRPKDIQKLDCAIFEKQNEVKEVHEQWEPEARKFVQPLDDAIADVSSEDENYAVEDDYIEDDEIEEDFEEDIEEAI